MKRALADFLLLAATSCATLLFFALFLMVFQVPNRAGLAAAAIADFSASFLSFALKFKVEMVCLAFVVCLALRVGMKVLLGIASLALAGFAHAGRLRAPRLLSGFVARGTGIV